MMKILIIEDAQSLRNELKLFLGNYGYEVEAPDDFRNVLDHVTDDIHLVLLDINLPVYDGFYLCREIRKVSQVPIIIVTSRDTEMDELMSISIGADDFVAKPYNTQILLARIESVLRRTYARSADPEVLSYKNLKLFLSNGTISYKGCEEELTKNEFKILHYLMKQQGKIIPREELMEHLWSSDLFVDDNTLSVNITRLRKKIEATGMDNPIEARRGMGYILE
ncbi:MAG: response regulator transcription factor [Bacillus sp. (in: firmicutes)]